MDNELQIRFLDHVAIRVLDLNKSVEWYENVLNLKKYQKPEWGEFSVMMLADKSGIAIFPVNIEDEKIHDGSIVDYLITKSNFIKITYSSFLSIGLIFMSISGVFLWYLPKKIKERKQ